MSVRRVAAGAIVLGAVGLAVAALVGPGGGELKGQSAPQGIVSFELSWSSPQARDILKDWGPGKAKSARNALRWDWLLFIPSYVALGVGVALSLSWIWWERGSPSMARLGKVAAAMVLAAGVADASGENILLYRMLSHPDRNPRDTAPLVASSFAAVKFGLIALALCYVLVSLPFVVPYALRRLRRTRLVEETR